METRLFLVTLLFGAHWTQCFAQNNPTFTKTDLAVCTRTGTILTFDITVTRNSDPVCIFKASNSNLTLVPDNQCSSNLNNYDPVTGVYRVSASVDMDSPNTPSPNKCGINEVFPDGLAANDQAFRLWLLCREDHQGLNLYGFYDALYVVTCYRDAATSAVVTIAEVTVVNPGFVQELAPAPFTVSLHVMRYIQSTGTYSEVTPSQTLILGERFALEARLIRNAASPRGVYLYDTRISNNNAFLTAAANQDATYLILAAEDGCPVTPAQPYIPTAQFSQVTCTDTLCVTRTGLMTAVQLESANRNRLYFRSSVSPCLVEQDPKCLDFCDSNKPGRRKRSLDNNVFSCETYVMLSSPTTPMSSDVSEDIVIIAVATSCAAVLLIMVVVGTCALIRKKRRQQEKKAKPFADFVVEPYGSKKQIIT